MESKILNFVDAMKLAEVLDAAIPKAPNWGEDGFAFTKRMINNISPINYLRAVELLTGVKKENLLNLSGEETISLFIEGLQKNRIAALVQTYRRV